MKKEKLKTIYDLLPAGWQEAAKEKKALQRGRNIRTAEELLRLVFLYETSGDSYGLTAAITQLSEEQKSLSKPAVQKRINHCGDWLQWICVHLCQQEGFLVTPPEWLKPYRVCVVDASDYAKQGSHQADFRFHYIAELFTLNTAEMYFTTAGEGETLSRYGNIRENDLIIGDRAYGTLTGIKHVLEHKAHFLLRLRSNGAKLYNADGSVFNMTEELMDWNEKKTIDLNLFYQKGKEVIPVRVCAIAKTKEQIAKSQRHIKDSNNKDKRGKISDLQHIWSKYVVVITSLPTEITTQQILELYRMRWQIELIFKQFKSIFGGGSFSARKEESVKAWFYGKLLIAIICQTLVKRARFSPTDDPATL